MLPQLTLFISLVIKYLLFYFLIYLIGRSFLIIISLIYRQDYKLPKNIFGLKSSYLYPIIGLIITGNILVLINFFIPLKGTAVLVILLLLLIPNFYFFNKEFLTHLVNFNFIFLYLIIPSILIFSTSDITFHYDAGYYHLNHQNWLRESNLIIGMINIFWAFGMSSIYEYISAILWIDSSFVLLHFLSLYFVHLLYIFLTQKALDKSSKLRYVSLFVLIYSIFDNFGFSGGRNGYIYIQEVGKQDVAVAILFFITTFVIAEILILKKINKFDFLILSLMTFFIFQIKLSGIFIYLLFTYLIYSVLKNKLLNLKNIFVLLIPNIFFSITWFAKSYLTTGCFVFPVNITCLNSFDWYIKNSTKDYQEISTDASFSYIQYYQNESLTFIDWFKDFFFSEQYASFSNYYTSFYSNFIISLIIILILKKLFFLSTPIHSGVLKFLWIFALLNIIYLVFFGPIPRYTMGILTVVIGLLGINVSSEKIRIYNIMIYFLIFSSAFLLVRLNSYQKFYSTNELALSDPRNFNDHYEEVVTYDNWIKPSSGDRCWVNLKCTMHIENIKIIENRTFKTAYRK